MTGIDQACSYSLVRLVRLCLLKSADHENLGHLPDYTESARRSAILVLVCEVRFITVKLSKIGLEGAA